MNLKRALAFLCGFAFAVSSIGVASAAVELGDLIENGDSISSGDKLFSDFTFTPTGDFDPETTINVIPIIDNDGNVGIRFQGGFSDLTGGDSSGFSISYLVTVLDPNLAITGITLQGNPTAILSGVGQFDLSLDGLPNTLSIYDNADAGETDLLDATTLEEPVTQLQVNVDFSATAGSVGGVTASFVDQTFAQSNVVPEFSAIGTWLTLMAGVFGCVLVSKLRRPAEEPVRKR